MLANLSKLFPPKRPRGCAPFDLWLKIVQWFETHGRDPAIELMTEKIDGFQLIIYWDGITVRLYTKKGVEITKKSKGVLGVIWKIFHENFAHVVPQAVKHPQYGKARALFAEIAVLRDDAVRDNSACSCDLEDLRCMMHNKDLDSAEWVLKVFHCSFKKDDPALKKAQRAAVPLAERLDLCRQAFGEEFVVRTLIDARKPFTQENLNAALECYRFKEGVVVSRKGVLLKDKAPRPVSMLLVAVGMSNVQGVKLPTHFFWGVPNGGAYHVPLMDDRSFLFQDGRSAQGKIQLQPSMFYVDEYGYFSLKTDQPNYQTIAYSALLGMIGKEHTAPESVTPHEVVLRDKSKLKIAPNRSFKFEHPTILELRIPVKRKQGVIGVNQLWATGKAPYTVGAVHFQAPQFLACAGYGHEVYRKLLNEDDNTTPAETIVRLSTTASRDLNVHAQEVYGDGAPSLVFGNAFEEPDSDAPYTPDKETASTPEEDE